MNLKPQDILFLLKLVAIDKKKWSFNKLAVDLNMSPSEVHAAAKRAVAARLAIKEENHIRPNIRNLEEFLVHGIQYVFVPEKGAMMKGMPTAWAASSMPGYFIADAEPPSVWPDPDGGVRGESFSPLYKSAPQAARNDMNLYELLVLVDIIRDGKAVNRANAINELKRRLYSEDNMNLKLQGSDKDNLLIGGSIVVSRATLSELSQRYHIRRLALFGSAARGKLEAGSDIDLLVEFEPGETPSLGGMVKLKDHFVDLFGGYEVDLATPSILNNPYRRRSIEANLQELYAA